MKTNYRTQIEVVTTKVIVSKTGRITTTEHSRTIVMTAAASHTQKREAEEYHEEVSDALITLAR